MSSLIPFSFESHSVRAFNIDGNPWFVGKDVCDVLGYANASDAINQHCKG
ncbi:BRO family protein [Dokdonella sp.]|nr:BRO family protein [Dokdonella sp.]